MANIDKVRLNALTIKYLLGTLTDVERQELDAILDEDPIRRQRFDQRTSSHRLQQNLQTYLDIQKAQRIPVRTLRRYLPYAAAAVIIAIITLALYIHRRQPQQQLQQSDPIIAMQHDFQPGSNRAMLTLADGTTIDLDAAKNGMISSQNNAQIFKTDSGRIAYNTNKTKAATLAYNIVSTPRGGTYQVTLPDGSTAWLNAASSIRFPTSFANKREVQTTGEVYFDIASDAAKPFYVSSGAISIQVLGTEFDIQHYNNEPSARVTLVTGAIKVQAGRHDRVLTGQQQAKLTPETPITVIDNPDISQAIAWKTGFFRFKNADIRSIMREVERWYDVDVEYQVTDNAATYGGRISRGLPLSQLLRLLQGNNIHHYKMEGRKLIILP